MSCICVCICVELECSDCVTLGAPACFPEDWPNLLFEEFFCRFYVLKI